MSDFYGTIVAADAYHLARGNGAVWDAVDVTDEEKNAALLLASEWVDWNYESAINGYRTGEVAQLRAWPRTNAYDIYGRTITGIPVQWEYAVYEVALQEIKSPGSLFKTWTAGKDIKSVSVDGAISVTYAGAGSFADVQLTIPKISGILAPLLTGGGVSNVSGRTSRI
mgnify:CR=1 FL=1|jgi:hypothetical protein